MMRHLSSQVVKVKIQRPFDSFIIWEIALEFKKPKRYQVSATEDFEPDSDGQVLSNYLGVKSKEKMDLIEEQELERADFELSKIFSADHTFTAQDICNIHEFWLGNIYLFAGKYRTLTLSKDGFMFAAPNMIPALIEKLERSYLKKYTPCLNMELEKLAHAMSIVHVELILIHPFREGNGRTARLLANLMCLQANQPLLNFAGIYQTKNPSGFEKYIKAIHAGFNENYEPIQDIFVKLIKSSII